MLGAVSSFRLSDISLNAGLPISMGADCEELASKLELVASKLLASVARRLDKKA